MKETKIYPVEVKKCHAIYDAQAHGKLVCGNPFKIEFAFDEEWDGYDDKKAKIIFWHNGRYECLIIGFSDNVCPVPALYNIPRIEVGVFVENDICTTTGAIIECEKSINCGAPKNVLGADAIDNINKALASKAIPRMTVTDGEDGHNRVYYIKSGEPVETTATSVTIPEGKSIIVCAVSDDNQSDYSYLAEDGSPTAPPIPIGWKGALPTPTVTVDGTTATWKAIEGATKYKYIIGDVTPYMSWGGSFANTYNRVYVELTNDRGVYTRYALTSDVPPRDPDPEDFATGKTLGSIPLRQDNGYILSPALDANDEAALARLAAKGYNLDLYLMPKKYTDSYTAKYVAENINIERSEGEKAIVQRGGGNTATGKLSMALGQNNKVSGLRGFAAGTNNDVSGTCAAAFGEGCINTSWLGLSAGRYLKSLYNCQHWFGEFNNPVRTDVMGYRLIFGIGNGTSDANRKNALEVYSDGRVSIGREPKLDMDVVNKKYFDDKTGNIETALDSILAIQNAVLGGEA